MNQNRPLKSGIDRRGSKHGMRRVTLFLMFVCAGACAQSKAGNTAQQPDDVPEANPARPTVATPATLTPVGYLQFENGVLYATGSPDFSSRLGVNQVTKLTVHPRLQVLASSEPVVHSGLNGMKEFNPGDVLVGLQAVALPGQGRR